MAEPKVTPLFTLPKEVVVRMAAMESDMTKAKKALQVMKDLGMDTKDLEEKLTWADRVRTTLLKEFV